MSGRHRQRLYALDVALLPPDALNTPHPQPPRNPPSSAQPHQQKVYCSSCASDEQDAQDAQDVNSHSGCDVDPTPRPEDSLNVPLRPDKVLKRTLRPVRPDAFRR